MGVDKRVHVGRTEDLEFGGKLGAPFMILGMPIGVYFINLACNKASCSVWTFPTFPDTSVLFDITTVYIVLAWIGFQLALYLLPTGTTAQGLPLKSGKRLTYRCNAFISAIVSLLTFAALAYLGYPMDYIYDKFIAMATTALIFSFCLSVFLYIKALGVPNEELAGGGNSGNLFYDFFIGHELNPRIGPVDLKFFCELRPGLIGWVMLDLSFVAHALKTDTLTPALLIVTGFHAFYVLDALWFEEAILTTMDIVHDGFGYMLVFGDLVWVPFMYSIQARYVLEHPQHYSWPLLVAFVAFKLVGYTIFRGSNSQKNAFRKNPNDPALAHLKTMSTSAGRKLLISGWWGMCRHPNYLGDLIMGLAWSLPCGFGSIYPYFYPIYFLVLLVHRNMRDEVNCRHKYGADWDKYCEIVPYRIFPGIF